MHLAGADREAHVLQRADAAEALAQALDRQARCCGWHRHIGTGAAAGIRPSCFSSAQRSPGIGNAISVLLRSTSVGATAPGIIEETEVWPSGNCRAAAAIGTWWRRHTASMRATRSI